MIFITDKVTSPDIEKSRIGKRLAKFFDDAIDHILIRVLLVWHQIVESVFLDRYPNVHTVVRNGVDYDENITVFNNPAYGVDEVSDTTVGMLLSLSRGIFFYDENFRKTLDDSSALPSWQYD